MSRCHKEERLSSAALLRVRQQQRTVQSPHTAPATRSRSCWSPHGMLLYTGRMKRIKRLARRFWLPLTLLVVVAAILLLLVRLAFWGYQAGWTGFGPSP